jgi:hypothetical protein
MAPPNVGIMNLVSLILIVLLDIKIQRLEGYELHHKPVVGVRKSLIPPVWEKSNRLAEKKTIFLWT